VINRDTMTESELEGMARFHRSTADMMASRDMPATAEDLKQLAESYEQLLREKREGKCS